MTESISIWRLFGRLILVPLAFVVTLIAVGIFVAFSLATLDPDFSQSSEVHLLFTTLIGLFASGLLGGLVFAPAVIILLICEMFRLRSIFVYLAIGGAFGVMGAYVPAPDVDSAVPVSEDRILIAAGLIGGVIYWLLAGRSAGFVVRVPRASSR